MSSFEWRRAALGALGFAPVCAAVCASAAAASPFDILFFADDATPAQRSALTGAETFWESVVTGFQPGVDIGGPVEIDVFAAEIDGFGGTLALGGPDFVIETGGFTMPVVGSVFFDLADLPMGDENQQPVFETLLHEVAHVLGFGTLWEANGLSDGARYTGLAALDAFREEFDRPEAAFVPLATGIGEGSDLAHWDEDWPGGPFELMTPIDDGAGYMAATTVAAFRDLGYTTVSPQRIDPLPTVPPVPLPGSGWALLAGMAVMAGAARARRSSG